jgi:predicted dehydrogenase
MLRLSLIGCGSHAEWAHADPLSRYAARHPDEITLRACCDLNPERAENFRRRYGFARAYADWEEMLKAERPDAVVCVMPVERIVPLGSELLLRHVP